MLDATVEDEADRLQLLDRGSFEGGAGIEEIDGRQADTDDQDGRSGRQRQLLFQRQGSGHD
ncbi:hypothetical protein Q3H58_001913 [Pseudomonas psychrotolerans]|nr:hypothetical protein [Pseudomonas psychrotolerans]